MSNHLATYLNDHLAGSHSALEMLAALREIPGLEDWGARMTEEIGADQAELENLMGNLQIDRGVVRQAAGWVSGRLAELKTRIDDRKGGHLQRLELLELLALGIQGKKALWTALQAASSIEQDLRGPDYPRLIQRAVEQRQEVEIHRLAAAAHAFSE
jgi:hypothetical protein